MNVCTCFITFPCLLFFLLHYLINPVWHVYQFTVSLQGQPIHPYGGHSLILLAHAALSFDEIFCPSTLASSVICLFLQSKAKECPFIQSILFRTNFRLTRRKWKLNKNVMNEKCDWVLIIIFRLGHFIFTIVYVNWLLLLNTLFSGLFVSVSLTNWCFASWPAHYTSIE